MGWAKGIAASTAAGAGVFAVVVVGSDMPTDPETGMPVRLRLSTTAGTGAVFGLGFGIVRPLLPDNAAAAGGAYGIGFSMGVWLLGRAINRALAEPTADLPMLPLLFRTGSVEKIAEWAAAGACVALAERAARA